MLCGILGNYLPAGVRGAIVGDDDFVCRRSCKVKRRSRAQDSQHGYNSALPRIGPGPQRSSPTPVEHGLRPVTSAFAAVAGNTKKIMRHRVETGMDHFIVHGENENGVEVAVKGTIQRVAGFAIDVASLALR